MAVEDLRPFARPRCVRRGPAASRDSTLLNPARLFAHAWTRYIEPSSSHSGHGSIQPFAACTSVQRLPGPARVARPRHEDAAVGIAEVDPEEAGVVAQAGRPHALPVLGRVEVRRRQPRDRVADERPVHQIARVQDRQAPARCRSSTRPGRNRRPRARRRGRSSPRSSTGLRNVPSPRSARQGPVAGSRSSVARARRKAPAMRARIPQPLGCGLTSSKRLARLCGLQYGRRFRRRAKARIGPTTRV